MADGLQMLTPATIGNVSIRNRVIRSALCETMADQTGVIQNKVGYSRLYRDLAKGDVGLIFSGHCFVHPRGRGTVGMTGLNNDENIPFLRQLAEDIRKAGARMFLELNHTGSESRMLTLKPVAPSAVPNPQNGRMPEAATEDEIQEVISSFGAAALRVKSAGFDGVHVHAGHGYLLSTFLSPYTNRREDSWGGPLKNRQRLILEVVKSMRNAVGSDFPITIKLGIRDFVPNGLSIEEGIETAIALEKAGVDAIEVSAGITTSRVESALKYAGVSRKRAIEDKMVHRAFAKEVPGNYFVEDARRVRAAVKCPLIVVGGLRRVDAMESVIKDGVADFVSLGRPLIREPNLVRKIENGKRGEVDCVSCNICAMHVGIHPLKCWRKSNWDLLVHAWYRLTGRLKPENSLGHPKY